MASSDFGEQDGDGDERDVMVVGRLFREFAFSSLLDTLVARKEREGRV